MLPDNNRPILVFDLDQTILSVNSFPRWVLFLIAGNLPGIGLCRRVGLSLRVQLLLLARKLGAFGHGKLLRHLHAAWRMAAAGSGAATARGFQATLLRYLRSNLRPILTLVAAEEVDAILATAALSDYATGLGRQLGFRHMLMTPAADDPATFVNSGERKRDRVLELVQERGWVGRQLILFTDHLDDLPLIREACAVFWFGSPEDMAAADALAPDVCFVFCRDQSPARISAMLQALDYYAALAQSDFGMSAASTLS